MINSVKKIYSMELSKGSNSKEGPSEKIMEKAIKSEQLKDVVKLIKRKGNKIKRRLHAFLENATSTLR